MLRNLGNIRIMKIVHVFWSLSFGGIETMLVNIANAQTKLGADVNILIINEQYDDTLMNSLNPDVKVLCLHRKKHSKGFGFVLALNRALNGLHPDVIHLHDPHLFGIIFNRSLKDISCATLHDMPYGIMKSQNALQNIFPALKFRLYGNVVYLDEIPKVYSISNSVKDALSEKYGVKSVVVNNGIMTTNFKTLEKTTHQTPMRIVQVSRLEHEKKGQDLILKAIASMKDSVNVDFIGEGSSLEHLKRMCVELGIENNVHFLGKKTQSYIAEHLCNYDLFVQPSRFEGFGLTVAEAMAAGVPVLVSSGDGPAEITCRDKYGWVFSNGDIDDLIYKLKYINNNYVKAIDKATLGRNYVVENYDVSVTARKYLNEYKTLENRRFCNK